MLDKAKKMIAKTANDIRMRLMKPCPFCGCDNIKVEDTFLGFYVIKCTKCGIYLVRTESLVEQLKMDSEQAKKEAIEAWNRRV